ncbi:MAG: hypothetical protein HYY52_05320 [Candidatus Melainabacteria bacterium]|nr:hypothetical protein [Candidatus Melainabacteria bacterium]
MIKTIIYEQEEDLRKRLSVELCDNFVHRLNPAQTKEIKIGALIAIKNLIKESKIYDSFLFNYLIDTIVDPDKLVREIVAKIIKDVVTNLDVYQEIIELLEIKTNETKGEVKLEIKKLLKAVKK